MSKELVIQGSIEYGNSRYEGEEYSPTYLGGNGIIAATAASRIVPVQLIGCVGTDLRLDSLKEALGGSINSENITVLQGQTFRRKATYNPEDINLTAQEVTLGVYGDYRVEALTERVRKADAVFLAVHVRNWDYRY